MLGQRMMVYGNEGKSQAARKEICDETSFFDRGIRKTKDPEMG